MSDYYEEFTKHMQEFEENFKIPVKKEVNVESRKRTVKVEDDKTLENISRYSGRVRSQPKYFSPNVSLEDSVDSTSQLEAASEETNKPPPIKKPKVEVKEETLDELFISSFPDPRFMFRGAKKQKLCRICFKAEGLFKCTGECSGHYHLDCLGNEALDVNEPEMTILCNECKTNTRKCFVCKNAEPKGDENVEICSHSDCGLSFHLSCLKWWPQSTNKNKFYCPQHHCHACHYKTIEESAISTRTGPMARCVLCPSTFHHDMQCMPAGSRVLSTNYIICPRHDICIDDEELITSKKAKQKMKFCNFNFCGSCSLGGELVCCENCPAAYHRECTDEQTDEDKFFCLECRAGKQPVFNQIYIAKVTYYN